MLDARRQDIRVLVHRQNLDVISSLLFAIKNILYGDSLGWPAPINLVTLINKNIQEIDSRH